MLGIPGFADGPRGQRIFNLRRLDAAMDARLTFTGGGNRQRRRIRDAVGPERANYARRARTYSDVSWAKEGTGTGSAPVIVSESVADPDGGTTATRVTFDLGGGTTLSDVSRLTQYEPTGTTVGAAYTQGLWAKIPLGESILMRNVGASAYSDLAGTGGWKRYSRTEISAAGQCVVEIGLRGGLPGAIGSDAVTVDLWWATLEDGTELTPVVPNDTAGTVTTTDWPRRNHALVSEGTIAHLHALGYFTTAPISIRGFDNSIAIPAGSALAGPGFAYKACAFPDGTLVGVSLFVEMDDGGAPVPSTSGGPAYDFMLVADGFGIAAADCIVEHVRGRLYRVSGSKVASLAGGGNAFYGVVKYPAQSERGCRVTGWHVRDMLSGFDAYIKTTGDGATVNTPPFGEIVTVSAGQPRIEYGVDGFARGVKVASEATNNVGQSENFLAWTPYPGGVGTYKELWDPVWGKFIRITKTGDTGEARCGLLIDITALSGDGCSAGIKMRRVTAGASGQAPYVDAYGGSGLSTANRFFSDANTPLGEWVDYAVSTGPGNALTGAAKFYVWVESAIGSIVDFCFPQCNGGQKLLEYVPTYGDETVAPAEALKFHNMDTFGLNQDAWTIIIEATEPGPDPTPGYPMILRMTGPGGVVATINKQPDGQIEFQIYDGATNVAQKLPAGTIGTTRRYLLGFDRASQTMRYAATGASPASATGASLATVGPYTVVQIGSADGFWWCNNITSQIETYPYLMSAEEMTRRL